MKNRIRGHYLIVFLTVLSMAACGTTRKSTTGVSRVEQHSRQSGESVARDASVYVSQLNVRQLMQTGLMTRRRECAEPVPQQQAAMRISVQSLLNLPEGAKFGTKEGRASVEAVREGDHIVVTGRCDSLMRRCLYFEEVVSRQQQLIDSLNRAHRFAGRQTHSAAEYAETTISRTRQSDRRRTGAWFPGVLAGFLAGGAASALLTKTNPLKAFVSLIKRIAL